MSEGSAGVCLDAPAKSLHQRVHASQRDVSVVRPHAREQRLAAEDDARMRGQQVQQPELLRGEIDFVPANADSAPSRVDLDAVHVNRPIRRRRSVRRPARPPQSGKHVGGAAGHGRAPPSRACRTAWRGNHRRRSPIPGPCRSPRAAPSASAPGHPGSARRGEPRGRWRCRPRRGASGRGRPGRTPSSPSRSKASRPSRDGRGLQALETEVEPNQIPDVGVVFDDERVRHG